MEFLKNINGEFFLKKEYDFFKNLSHINKFKFLDLDYEIKVLVEDMNISQIKFKIASISNIDELINKIIDHLIQKLNKDVSNRKLRYEKTINEWKTNPTSFIEYKDKWDVIYYINENILIKDEQINFLIIGFLNYNKFFNKNITYGENHYYNLKYYEDALAELDKWSIEILNNLKETKLKTRFKNMLLNHKFSLDIKDVIEYIQISNSKKIEINKSDFPFTIDGEFMNDILGHDPMYVDDIEIKEFKEEYDLDISFLKGWNIAAETEDYAHHDSDTCDYEVTLTSPEGIEYRAYTTYNAIAGFRFNGIVNFS